MKRVLILILTTLCLAPLPLAAQAYKSAPVTLSKDKVTQNGKVYFVHTVQDHQTLFSISRAYGVTYQEIVDANPDSGTDISHGNIRTGQILLIPQKEIPGAVAPARSVPSDQKPAETVTAAPQTAAQAKPQATPQTTPIPEEYTLYTAKWYEDLNMIAAKFNVSKEVLMAYNGMTSETITPRQRILIPAHPENVQIPETILHPAVPEKTVASAGESEDILPEQEIPASGTDDDTLEDSAGKTGFSLKDLFRKKQASDRISVGVILPFGAKGQINHSAFDLYSGMLLAVRDLAKGGIKAELTVIDSRNASTPVTSSRLDACDLVIGPIAPEDLEKVLDLCPRSTAVVSPLDPKAVELARSHSNFIQAPSPVDAQYDDIVDWLRSESLPDDKILLIQEKDVEPTPLAAKLAASGLNYTLLESGPKERASADRMAATLSPRQTLRAVIASDKEGFVNEVVRNLTLLSYRGVNTILYAPSKIRTFDMIEAENLHRVQLHLSCSYFIDYDNPRIKDFLLSYRALFGAEPTQFSYQGYDAASYFIRNFATAERERERMTRLEDRKYRGIQSDFLIGDEWGSGHVNRAVRRVVYGKDYSVTLLNR